MYSVKRLMGRGVADVKEELKLFPFHIAAESESVIKLKSGPPHVHAVRDLRRRPKAVKGQCRSRTGSACHGSCDHGSRVLQ